jgi:hypothetical protein
MGPRQAQGVPLADRPAAQGTDQQGQEDRH